MNIKFDDCQLGMKNRRIENRLETKYVKKII